MQWHNTCKIKKGDHASYCQVMGARRLAREEAGRDRQRKRALATVPAEPEDTDIGNDTGGIRTRSRR